MKLFMALGTGNIVDDLRRHTQNDPERAETSITFSQQAYDYVKHAGISALFVSGNVHPDQIKIGDITAIHTPSGLHQRAGLSYHLHAAWYALKLALMARKFGADLAIVDSGMTHNFLLSLFRLFNIKIVVGMHNVRWAIGYEPERLVAKLVRALDSVFFRYVASAAIGCSPECERQARADGADQLPFFQWRGQYLLTGFNTALPSRKNGPFRILFAGRVERNKGVFDILAIATALIRQCATPVIFEICGDGDALDELRGAVNDAALSDSVLLRGRLNRTELLAAYARAHVVIVPTRSDFCEGMPLVCSEAVLAGRPIITSRITNSLPLMSAAIAEAEPENVDSYVEQIIKLIEVPGYYDQRAAACNEVSRPFLDRSKSYSAVIDRVVTHICPDHQPMLDYTSLFQ